MGSGDIAPRTVHAWWRSAVIYQVYPRSFADANGDGVGDLPGVTARLGHLASLGVDAVWLSPFYRSPMIDGGYDVADYRDIDPIFGTLADFDVMLAEAHRLELRVIVDIVPNHTSSAHAWFHEALAAPLGSPARERYVFRNGRAGGTEPPNDWQSVFGGPAWTRVADGTWYLHLFDSSQPDLNWLNPEVRSEFAALLRFWLDRGVDGFRIDVAHGMIKAPGLPDVGQQEQSTLIGQSELPYFDQEGVHEIYREWRKILDSYPGARIGVAEAWTPGPERTARYVRPDELHQAFNFDYVLAPWSEPELRKVITASLAASDAVAAPTTWVLSNHDVRRHVTRYGGGALGVRRARAAWLLMLALPGSAYLYQGEELGLPELLDLPDELRQDPQWFRSHGQTPSRDGCRVPIPWSGQVPPFGFGPDGSTASWLPAPAAWAALTVERQHADPGSMLNLYIQALRLRREHPALGAGSTQGRGLRWLDAPDGVIAFAREPDSATHDSGTHDSAIPAAAPSDASTSDSGLICAVNFTDAPVTLPWPGELLLASGPVNGAVIAPDTAVWLSTSPAQNG